VFSRIEVSCLQKGAIIHGRQKKNAWQNPWEQKNAWDTTALVRRFYYSDTIYSCPNTITITLLLSRYFCSLSACVDKIPEMRKKVKTKKDLRCVLCSVPFARVGFVGRGSFQASIFPTLLIRPKASRRREKKKSSASGGCGTVSHGNVPRPAGQGTGYPNRTFRHLLPRCLVHKIWILKIHAT
jgi:hypothetical protein